MTLIIFLAKSMYALWLDIQYRFHQEAYRIRFRIQELNKDIERTKKEIKDIKGH